MPLIFPSVFVSIRRRNRATVSRCFSWCLSFWNYYPRLNKLITSRSETKAIGDQNKFSLVHLLGKTAWSTRTHLFFPLLPAARLYLTVSVPCGRAGGSGGWGVAALWAAALMAGLVPGSGNRCLKYAPLAAVDVDPWQQLLRIIASREVQSVGHWRPGAVCCQQQQQKRGGNKKKKKKKHCDQGHPKTEEAFVFLCCTFY